MKEFIKNNLLGFIIGGIVFGGIGVIAYTYNASQISYSPSDNTWNVSNVKAAIDDLKTNGTSKKICELKSGEALAIGSMYECDPGDNTKRNFYVLTVKGDGVDLIMDRNISTGTMTWNNAMKYFQRGAGSSIPVAWKDVQKVDLPSAQAISDAVGNSSWIAADSGETWWCFASKTQDSQSDPWCNTEQASAYSWLYDYTRACQNWGCLHSLGEGNAYGYWTRDVVAGLSQAWRVTRNGSLGSSAISNGNGVRPIIAISKSNIK